MITTPELPFPPLPPFPPPPPEPVFIIPSPPFPPSFLTPSPPTLTKVPFVKVAPPPIPAGEVA